MTSLRYWRNRLLRGAFSVLDKILSALADGMHLANVATKRRLW